MFNLSEWIKEGIIEGYKSGEFSKPKITELTANYLIKGIFTDSDAEEIAKATTEGEIENGENTDEADAV